MDSLLEILELEKPISTHAILPIIAPLIVGVVVAFILQAINLTIMMILQKKGHDFDE